MYQLSLHDTFVFVVACMHACFIYTDSFSLVDMLNIWPVHRGTVKASTRIRELGYTIIITQHSNSIKRMCTVKASDNAVHWVTLYLNNIMFCREEQITVGSH